MNLIVSIVGVLTIGALYVVLPVIADAYRRLRGPRVVRCPETGLATEIELDGAKAARGAVFGRSTLRVHDCTRWQTSPAHRFCDQECLKGITFEAAQSHGLLISPSGGRA